MYRSVLARPANSDVPLCHRLHYLQMACEKLAKAYRFRDTNTSLDRLLTEHTGFAEFVQALVRSPEFKARYAGKTASYRQTVRVATGLAREVERLAPAVDRDDRPDNAEYPWLCGDEVRVPCEHGFPNLALLWRPGGRQFLQCIEEAVNDFPRRLAPDPG
jgi:hypothetical protein